MMTSIVRKLAIVLLGATWTATALWPQSSADWPWERSLTAHGRSALEGLRTVVLEALIEERGKAEPLRIAISLDGYARWDYLDSGRSIVTTPSLRFEIRQGRFFHRPPHVGAFGQLDVLGGAGLLQLTRLGGRLEFFQNNILESQLGKAFRASTGRVVDGDGSIVRDVVDVYVDEATNLVRGISRQGIANRGQLAFADAYAFSDHRDVQGIQVPHRMERYLDGVLQQVIAVERVELNAPLDFRIFEFR